MVLKEELEDPQEQRAPAWARRAAQRGLRDANKQYTGKFTPVSPNTPVYTQENYRPQTPPATHAQSVEGMTNYDRLTPVEQKIYSALPGISESGFGKALQWFGGTWAGKLLSYIDVFAETTERVAGTGAQLYEAISAGEMDDFDLGSAWYASSLAADMTNLPVFRRDENGRIVGAHIPTDLPGMAGLVDARKKIASGVPLEQVREEYYDSLGALQLRAQLYDVYSHVLLDPLNLLPFVKPVQGVQKARIAILGKKIMPDEVAKLKNVMLAAEKAGNIEEAAKIAGQIEKYGVTRADRLLITLTGGEPLKPGKLAKWYNPFALTPTSRAHEYLTMVQDHVGSYILRNMDDPAEMVSAISRAAKGAVGPEFGHAFLTYEGRTVQAALGGFETVSNDLYTAYRAIDEQRTVLERIADVLGGSVHDTMRILTEGNLDALSARLSAVGIDIAPDILKKLGMTLKGTPYSPDLFKLMLTNALADHAARQGVLQFGVKARGFLEKASLTLKSAETLAFLRLNPAYAVRNYVNNEFTMLARGLAGGMTSKDMATFWKEIGWEPPRLKVGFGMAGETVAGMEVKSGTDIIADALRGERGFLDKVADGFNKTNIGPADMSVISARVERQASLRAFTNGFIQWLKQGWRPGKGFDKAEDFLSPAAHAAMEQRYPGMTGAVERAVQSAKNNADIDKFTKGNLNIAPATIFEEASKELGFDITKVLPEEFIAKIEGGLNEAAQNGTVKKFLTGVRTELQEHLDEISKNAVESAATYTETQIGLEGPGALPRVWGDVMDDFWGAHMRHATSMEELGAVARSAADPQVANELWNKLLADNEKYWGRAWDRLHGTVKGMKKGARRAGIKVSDDVLDSFKTIEKETREFFKFRNSELDTFFTARRAGETPPKPWPELQAGLDARYQQLIETESSLTLAIDQKVAQSLPTPELQDLYMAWRNRARELRTADKEAVVAFRAQIEGLSPKARDEAYARFWKERQANWTALWENERQGLAMLSGNEDAAAQIAARLPEPTAPAPVEQVSDAERLVSGIPTVPPGEEALHNIFIAYKDKGAANLADLEKTHLVQSGGATVDDVARYLEGRGIQINGRAPAAAIPETPATATTVTRQVTNRTTAFGTDPTRAYEFEYKVVDLGDLKASHSTTGAVNPDFPKELQPRLRERTASRQQVERIARELEPDAMLVDTHRLDSGPMIIGDDLVVESGNGRTMALRVAKEQYPDRYAEYVRRLREELPGYGLADDALEGVENPVLVRVRKTDVDRVEFAAEANQSAVLALAPFETAVQDARYIRDSALANLSVGETQSIDQALQSTTNSDFIRSFIGQLPENERAALVDAAGNLNPAGLQRLKFALFASTYPGESGRRLLQIFSESLSSGVKNVESAMFASLPDMSRMESAVRAGIIGADYTIADDISKTLDVFARLRQEGMSVADYLAQGTMFQPDLNDFQATLLRYFGENARSQKVIRETLRNYAREALEQPSPNQMSMFGEVAAKPKGQVFDEAISKVRPDEGPLFAAAEPAADATRAAERVTPTAPVAPQGEELAGPLARGVGGAEEAGAAAGAGERAFIPDAGAVLKPEPPIAVAEDQFWLNRGFSSLDEIERATIRQAEKPPLKWALPKEAQGELESYITHVKGQMSDAYYQATRYGEFRRDSALLNYTRRYNYNTYLGMLAPYEFWATQSLAKWALHSIDRPAMLSAYLRIKQFMETSGIHNEGLPSRLRGSVRIALPFLPDWMGDAIFANPLQLALPFEQFGYWHEQWREQQTGTTGRTERALQDMVQGGEISPEAATAAIEAKSGPLWDQASTIAAQDSEKYDAFDFMTMMVSPHAPLAWAHKLLKGKPEEIGPFMPLTRLSKSVSGLLGIEQFPLMPHNIEGKARKMMGLPAYDQWEDYRVDRMIANMAATGEITADDALRSMIDRRGDAFDEAVRKAGKEFGLAAAGSSLIGLPLRSYPEGERLQRQLKDDFGRAYELYRDGNEQALANFFERHPEYEARLALFKEPERRLQQFLIDELWDRYNSFPKLNRDEIREQLGEEFQTVFISKETRSYDSISTETMQVWLKLMGGDPPGTLGKPVKPLELAPSDVAYRADTFYKTRGTYFPDFYDLQRKYFMLAERGTARKEYLKDHPELKEYWDWRRDWFHRNPDVVPYLSDDYKFEYESEEDIESAFAGQPDFTWAEWSQVLTPAMQRLVVDHFVGGENIPPGLRTVLERLADDMGIDYEELLEKMGISLETVQ